MGARLDDTLVNIATWLQFVVVIVPSILPHKITSGKHLELELEIQMFNNNNNSVNNNYYTTN